MILRLVLAVLALFLFTLVQAATEPHCDQLGTESQFCSAGASVAGKY
jgi:hypothetical protein